ncbi:hypothetical protein F4679DRAFT_532075 [Xylaria curta]|nr:hypothetical protein F4679DRAFT_532075 [Xylaria curta]
MTSLQKQIWLGFSVIALSQSTPGFVEFVAPQENETILSDSTYIIRWATKSSNGRGTMTLLGGQTSESLSKLWEIAYSIDVAGGSFSWPVGFPTLAGSLSSFYSLNLSLDGSEDMFSISPPFVIVSNGDRDHDEDPLHTPTDTPPTPLPTLATSLNTPASSSSNPHHTPTDTPSMLLPTPVTGLNTTSSPSNPTFTFIMSTSEVSTSSIDDGYIVSSISSGHSSYTASPTQGPVSGSRISNGAIAGIAIGATTALAAFASLIGLALYYRRKLSSGKKPSNSEQSSDSKIDGKFRKAELDAEGPQFTITRVYELDATREVQEADGRMKPAELDSAVPSSGSHAANVQVDSVWADGDSIIEDECSEH